MRKRTATSWSSPVEYGIRTTGKRLSLKSETPRDRKKAIGSFFASASVERVRPLAMLVSLAVFVCVVPTLF
jgi:hypothetical protein